MTLRNILAATAVVVTIAAAGGPAASAAEQATIVRVTARDFSFVLSTKTVRRGRITFVIRNSGHDPHDFAIAGRNSRVIEPGQTTRLTVTLRPGRYAYRCTVDHHAELGMRGVLRVRA